MKNENEKARKFNIVIYLLVLVTLFTMLIGTSYAYYIKTIKNGDETKVVIKSSNMLLRFYDGNQINAYDIEPNWESTYNFSIENYSPDTAGKYKIIFDIEKFCGFASSILAISSRFLIKFLNKNLSTSFGSVFLVCT